MAGPNKPNDPNNGGDNDKRKGSLGFLGIVIWALILVLLLNTCYSSMQNASTITVDYSEFYNWVVRATFKKRSRAPKPSTSNSRRAPRP